MFKSYKYSKKIHPYHDALHHILYYEKDGLNAREIADKLKISDLECEHLLKAEQILDNVDVNPFTGTLIYKTKKNSEPINSLDETLKAAKKIKICSNIRLSFSIFSFSLFSFTLISIPLNISIFINMPMTGWFAYKNQGILLEPRVQAKLDEKKKIKQRNQIDDLKQRINRLKSSASNCYKFWYKDETCYIEGRLLTKIEFDKEIAKMRYKITQIEKS